MVIFSAGAEKIEIIMKNLMGLPVIGNTASIRINIKI